MSPLSLSLLQWDDKLTTLGWQQIVRLKPTLMPPQLAHKLDKLDKLALGSFDSSCGATVSCLLSNLRGTGTVPRFAVVQPPDIRKPLDLK